MSQSLFVCLREEGCDDEGTQGIEMRGMRKEGKGRAGRETWCITLQKMMFLNKSTGLLLSLKNPPLGKCNIMQVG